MRLPTRGRRAGRLIPLVVVAVILGVVPVAASELGTPTDYDMRFPVDGEHSFSDTFWAGRFHGAHSSQDIFAEKGVPVVAVADGVVRYVNWTARGHLNPDRCCSVVIDHDDGWQSTYLHLNNDTPDSDDGAGWGIADGIVPGVDVDAGQLVGWVGDSQRAEDTPPHLHFELRDPSGTLVNSYPALVAGGGNATDDGISDPAFDGTYAMREGDAGLHVRRLQAVLAELGYDVAVDGDFGPATQAVVIEFQESSGLEADGLFGWNSKRALTDAYAQAEPATPAVTATLRRGSRGEEVATLQKELDQGGYSPGVIDGIFGPKTEEAVIAFQRDAEIAIDGIVGPQTRRAFGWE